MNDTELLKLHRELVAIPSVSHEERRIVAWLDAWFRDRGLRPERMGNNLVLTAGEGPALCLNSHLDTVPPAAGWTRDPHLPHVSGGCVFGLGSNDAKASVAAMTAAFLSALPRVVERGLGLMLVLVVEEETGGKGAELVVAELARRGRLPEAVVIGEPTGLDIAVAQKGLMVLDLVATGTPCHAAHARARGARNAIRALAEDLLAVDKVDLGPADPLLGPVTVEPTVLSGGGARNAIPGEASCVLDVRTNPQPAPLELVARLREVARSEIRIRSDRLRPCATPPDHALVQSARNARSAAQLIGSRTLSDWVYFADLPAIKVGPGATERSHTPDEFVLEAEILEGAAFYEALIAAYGVARGRRSA